MRLPPDWDVPAEDNEKLCQKFIEGSFLESGQRIQYRLFVPRTRERVPLVIYLHGADAAGEDNKQPLSLHDIGTMYARRGWQKNHPCFILAPQYERSTHWSMPEMRQALMGLILHIEKSYDLVDSTRLYIYGYSAGGVGTLRMLKEYPGCFASALSICGATSPEKLDLLTKVPLWLVHAKDDEIVKSSYNSGDGKITAHLGSRDLYEALKDKAWDIRYTEFPAGYMQEKYGVNPHCSWVAVSDSSNRFISEWLFSHRKAGRYEK